MTCTLAVDPGKHKHALAWFSDCDTLTQVAHAPVQNVSGVDELVIEIPDRVTGSTLADILDLRAAAERVILLAEQRGARVRQVRPSAWKGTTPKPIHHRRIWDALRVSEREIVARFAKRSPAECYAYIEEACRALATGGKVRYGWATHNVLDAVGLGLWHLGRVDRTGRMQ